MFVDFVVSLQQTRWQHRQRLQAVISRSSLGIPRYNLRYVTISFSGSTSNCHLAPQMWNIQGTENFYLWSCLRHCVIVLWLGTSFRKRVLPPSSTTSGSIKMKRNRSLNTTNGLLVKMESSYITTCFGLHLWPSSGYSLVALRIYTICLTLRWLMSYIYGAPILDVSRSHTTTHHSR